MGNSLPFFFSPLLRMCSREEGGGGGGGALAHEAQSVIFCFQIYLDATLLNSMIPTT